MGQFKLTHYPRFRTCQERARTRMTAEGISGSIAFDAARRADLFAQGDRARRERLREPQHVAERSIVGTQEPVDPVRVLTNRSSGKMGYAIAEAARDRGADTVLVSAPTALADPVGVRVVRVETALQMREAVLEACQGADILIMAAAVADWRSTELPKRA